MTGILTRNADIEVSASKRKFSSLKTTLYYVEQDDNHTTGVPVCSEAHKAERGQERVCRH
jgi:hypothetical protein